VVIKKVDGQGRIVIPKQWREKYLKGRRVIMRIRGDVIEIMPERVFDLTRFFDSIEVDVRSDLADWHKVKKELRKTG